MRITNTTFINVLLEEFTNQKQSLSSNYLDYPNILDAINNKLSWGKSLRGYTYWVNFNRDTRGFKTINEFNDYIEIYFPYATLENRIDKVIKEI